MAPSRFFGKLMLSVGESTRKKRPVFLAFQDLNPNNPIIDNMPNAHNEI
jgi:hypothetical protein